MKFIKKKQEDYFFNLIAKKGLKKKKSKEFDNDFYNKLKNYYDDRTFGEILKNEDTNGCCYFYALMLAKNMVGSTLCVGNLNRLNSVYNYSYIDTFGHGWVEKDNLVYDTTSKQIFDKDYYYHNYNAEVKEKISSDELKNFDIFKSLLKKSVENRSKLDKLSKIVLDKESLIEEQEK